MTRIIKWVRDFEADVGSILIYRSDSMNGTYSQIAEISAKSGSDWVGSYADSTGTIDSWYKIQTYSSLGSSEFSDPISGEFWYLLSELDDVKRELRLNSMSDISDEEIYLAIVDTDDWIYEEYGNPVVKTYSYFSQSNYTYDFTGDKKPTYKIDNIYYEDDSREDVRIETGSFSINNRQSYVTFDANLVDSNHGRIIKFEYIPNTYHLLSKYKSALDIAESNFLSDGDKVIRPEVTRLQKKVDSIINSLKPKGVFNATTEANRFRYQKPGDYIKQEFT
jgi:hypothetical protein